MIEGTEAHRFLYVISTGRCGTQWLANALGGSHADQAVVEHEPLGPAYRPKETLRSSDGLAELAARGRLAEHLDRIDRVLGQRTYVECGWPAFAAVPLFIERYAPRLRLVHLVRHPVPTALSYLTHGFYRPTKNHKEYMARAQLDPFDAGIVNRQYQGRWKSLSAFEMCLFQWLEIHTWAEEIKRTYPEVPLLTVRMEDLFGANGGVVLDGITDLAGLPRRPAIHRLRSERMDKWRLRTEEDIQWRRVFLHPEVVSLARHYGYDFRGFEKGRLAQRYRAPLVRRLRVRWKASSLRRLWNRPGSGWGDPAS